MGKRGFISRILAAKYVQLRSNRGLTHFSSRAPNCLGVFRNSSPLLCDSCVKLSLVCVIEMIISFVQAIGAVSCMIQRSNDGKLIAYNVDYLGAIAATEEALRGS